MSRVEVGRRLAHFSVPGSAGDGSAELSASVVIAFTVGAIRSDCILSSVLRRSRSACNLWTRRCSEVILLFLELAFELLHDVGADSEEARGGTVGGYLLSLPQALQEPTLAPSDDSRCV